MLSFLPAKAKPDTRTTPSPQHEYSIGFTILYFILLQILGLASAFAIHLLIIATLLKFVQWLGPSLVAYTLMVLGGHNIVVFPRNAHRTVTTTYEKLSHFKAGDAGADLDINGNERKYKEIGERVRALADRNNFPLGELWVVHRSRWSDLP